MRPFSSICILAFALSLAAQTATQSTPQKKKVTPSTAQTTTAPAKNTAGTKSGRTAATKSGTRTTKRAASTARPRKSTPPRQQTPSADRYAEIQQALAAKGYFTGQANGVWGPDSIEALKRFQADQKLPPDGKIGSLSLIALGLGPKHEPGGEVAAKSQE